MNACRDIETLLYLHREGELTPAELSSVRAHLDGCLRCSAVLRDLNRMDEALKESRLSGHEDLADRSVVDRTMESVRGPAPAGRPTAVRRAVPGLGSGILRPAFGFLLLCASLLLTYQQGRDSYRMMLMEDRLAARASDPGQVHLSIPGRLARLIEGLTPTARRNPLFAPSGASIVPGYLIPGMGGDLGEFDRDGGELFRMYAGKYPALSTVNPYDGIDERERNVLSTEGKEFLDEFNRLLMEGEQR